MLKGAGHTVYEAADGLEVLVLAKSESGVDLVLSDINMPKMDGISLLKALRELPAFKFTPILMLTTESSIDRENEGKAAGATGWIVKPFNPEQLIDTIRMLI